MAQAVKPAIPPLVAYLLLSSSFSYSGLNIQLSHLFEPSVLLMAALVLVVSFAGKFGAVGLAARAQMFGRPGR